MTTLKQYAKQNVVLVPVVAAFLSMFRLSHDYVTANMGKGVTGDPALRLNLEFGLANAAVLPLAAVAVPLIISGLNKCFDFLPTRKSLKQQITESLKANVQPLVELSIIPAFAYLGSRFIRPELKAEDAAEKGGIVFLWVAAAYLALRPFVLAGIRSTQKGQQLIQWMTPAAELESAEPHAGTPLTSPVDEEAAYGSVDGADSAGDEHREPQQHYKKHLVHAAAESGRFVVQAFVAIGLIAAANQWAVPHYGINKTDANLQTLAGLGTALPIFLGIFRAPAEVIGDRRFANYLPRNFGQ